jgi:hypothetical protein
MAGEIEQFNFSVSELSGDNANIKCVLDIKQNKWTKADQKAKKSSKPAINKEKIPLTPNAFQILDVEENRVLAMTKIPKKPITQGDHLRTQLVVEGFQNLRERTLAIMWLP